MCATPRQIRATRHNAPPYCNATRRLAVAFRTRGLRLHRPQGLAALLDAVDAYGVSSCARGRERPRGTALKLAYLSIDSTRFSSSDGGFPLDMMTLAAADRAWRQAHYDYDDLSPRRTWWNAQLTKLAGDMPDGPWVEALWPDAGGARPMLVRDEEDRRVPKMA